MAFTRLSGDVIAQIISLTTPQDACAMSSVSTNFRSIADSDQVWSNFLPPGCEDLIPQLSTKKSLYHHLWEHPVLINGRNMRLSLDKKSGKKCFMLGARDLSIIWGDDQRYWRWMATPESRFNEVALLRYVWWFHIIGRIETSMLSSGTNYAAYFVFRFDGQGGGFNQPVNSNVCIGSEEHDEGRSVTLNPRGGEPTAIRERADGWMEIEMGEFHNENGDGTLVCCLKEVDNYRQKSGLIVEGIELRPKETH
ncbi:LOW QUALITY PROTEIN: F-box protein PP2-B11-like [Rhodamnia argentea]|uniref:LOW QUALITY PROTEIN: F-box protein PP2-B11-like n=1 Tax=Rhodamnia argentea TaxID=178133 RepID=A0ABM3GZB0_9MYRT|nr:LOW QUALITY PROTEIN: F-box protein PP2-B11-like [Rhodamnia argentea]